MNGRARILHAFLGLVLAVLIVPSAARAQTDRASPAIAAPRTAALTELAWLAGDFEASMADGALNETRFMPPRAGVMTGMMRLSKAGRLLVQEFFVLRETDEGTIEMRLRHFDAELAALEEEPYVLRLSSWDGTHALFEPVGASVVRKSTITRTEAGWDGATEIVGADGSVQTIRSSFRRVS